MANYLVLGSGLVAGPCVEYLCRDTQNKVVVASNLLDEAEALASPFENANAVFLDVGAPGELTTLARDFDVVLSLVPPPFHARVARACITAGTHMVTASYQTDEMRALDVAAKDAGVCLFNEIGLDPGIDHLAAKKIIDAAHAKGEKIESFVSWCGGVPAPASNTNPLGYKFSWQPKGAILVLLNEALYLKNGEVERVQADALMDWARPVFIGAEGFQCYPNRNSVQYRDIYGLSDIQTLIRGTLRWPGFCNIMQLAKWMGLFGQDEVVVDGCQSWRDYIVRLNAGETLDALQAESDRAAWAALDWLGVFSETPVGEQATPLDAFCDLLLAKLSYGPDEQDMVMLIHKFVIRRPDGSRYCQQAVLRREGHIGGPSAMAQTVGLPIAMAARLLGGGHLRKSGLVLPVSPEIYEPLLDWLAEEGIGFEETTFEASDTRAPEFLAELQY